MLPFSYCSWPTVSAALLQRTVSPGGCIFLCSYYTSETKKTALNEDEERAFQKLRHCAVVGTMEQKRFEKLMLSLDTC